MPRPCPPRMSASAIADRSAEKRRAILAFLASGELCTSVDIVQMLLGDCDRKAASRTLHALQRVGLVVSEKINVLVPTLWGITAEGLAFTQESDVQAFRPGRMKPAFIAHRLELQRARLRAERQGWGYWIPTCRMMPAPSMRRGSKARKEKIPDALVKSPRGTSVAVEVELTAKSVSRYQEIIGRHMQMIEEGKYDLAHYLVPDGRQDVLARKFAGIASIRVRGQLVPFDDKYRKRLACFSLSDWPPPSQPKESAE